MLTLNRLYSDTKLFDEVSFRPGINIILGRYSGPEGSVNGIGKSTLVRLIDFAFLASRSDALSSEKHSFLKEHNVVLEFSLDQSHFQIKRSFGDLQVAHFRPKGRHSCRLYCKRDSRTSLVTWYLCLLYIPMGT